MSITIMRVALLLIFVVAPAQSDAVEVDLFECQFASEWIEAETPTVEAFKISVVDVAFGELLMFGTTYQTDYKLDGSVHKFSFGTVEDFSGNETMIAVFRRRYNIPDDIELDFFQYSFLIGEDLRGTYIEYQHPADILAGATEPPIEWNYICKHSQLTAEAVFDLFSVGTRANDSEED